MLELRPDRIRETPNWRREYFVISVFPVAIEPHPLAGPFDQPDLLRADVLIVALDIDGDDPHSPARGHDHVERRPSARSHVSRFGTGTPLAESFGLTPAMMCLIGIPSCPSGHSWAAIRLIASWVGEPLCCRLSLVRRTRGAAGAAASTKAAGQIFASAGFHTK